MHYDAGEMTQTIDPDSASVENRVAFSAPLVETSVSTRASFEVRSPKRLQVRFREAGIATPTLVDASLFSLPASVDVLGQSVDTTAVTSALEPIQSAARGVFDTLGEAMKAGFPSIHSGSHAYFLDVTSRLN